MDNQIEQSRRYLTSRTEWVIDESTFQVLNTELPMWIARVTTTHLTKCGEPEISFTVIAKGYDFFTVNDDDLPGLKKWLAEH